MTELHDRSRAQEERTAKLFGGRTTPRSGAGWKVKNDVRTDRFLIENKRTDAKKSITLKAVDLEGVRRNAIAEGRGRIGLVHFELNGRNYFVAEESDFMECTGEA